MIAMVSVSTYEILFLHVHLVVMASPINGIIFFLQVHLVAMASIANEILFFVGSSGCNGVIVKEVSQKVAMSTLLPIDVMA
jgi:hypothetical protein